MTKNVIQIRMPEKLADAIEGLVKTVRHFLGSEKRVVSH
jgi:hypothetical protein